MVRIASAELKPRKGEINVTFLEAWSLGLHRKPSVNLVISFSTPAATRTLTTLTGLLLLAVKSELEW